jgi:ABC-2 type transport system ATP-binding protein
VEQPTAIEVRGASRRYGGIQALDNVTLTIDAPATGLLGQNGAGKSTLMKAILGLVRLDAGEVQVLGHDARRDGEQVRRRIGYAPEHECLPPELTAADLCRHLAELRGLSRADAIRRASEVLFAVGLEEERSRVIGSFSLGMRQRVKIAQALVHAPELIILDEPTNGLDPTQRAETVSDSAPFVAAMTAAGLDCTVIDATTTRVVIRSERDRDVLRDTAASTGVGLRRLHRDGPSIEDELLEAIG